MKKYRVSRWRQLIWPQELFIDKYHVLTRKRSFPAFWQVAEESIPLSKLASIQIHRGLMFSKLTIENSGGPFPIIVNGLWNGQALEARFILEKIEREMRGVNGSEILDLLDENDEDDGDGNIPTDYDPGGGGGEAEFEPIESHQAPVPVSVVTQPRSNQSGTTSITNKSKSTKKSKTVAPPDQSYISDGPLPCDEFLNEPVNRVEEVIEEEWRKKQELPNIVKYNLEHPASDDRKVGEIEDDWQPLPPWATRETGKDKADASGIPEIDPVEFLNRDPNTIEATSQDTHPIDKIVGWWDRTKDEVVSAASGIKTGKRNLK